MQSKWLWFFFLVGIVCVGERLAAQGAPLAITTTPVISIADNDAPMPVFRDGKFHNPPAFNPTEFGFWDGVKFFMHRLYTGLFQSYHTGHEFEWYAPMEPLTTSAMPTVQWLGHATCLMRVNNFTILADPIFGDISFIFTYARALPVGIEIKKLPKIDMILISHNHRDHLDEPSMRALADQQPIVLVPEGVQDMVKDFGFKRVYSYSWWQQQTFKRAMGEQITCTFVPASHGSGRTLFDFNRSLWGGWVVQGTQGTLYFAGDTAYEQKLFSSIAHYFPSIDVAMIPIAPGSPRFWMSKVHLDAADSLKVCEILHPRYFIPIHWGTFKMSSDTFDAELNVLMGEEKKRLHTAGQSQLTILKVGQCGHYAPHLVA